MNDVIPKLEHLMRRFLVGIEASEGHRESGPRHLTTLGGGYRRVLLVLDRNSIPEVAVRDLLARMPGDRPELVILRLLPEWAQDGLEAQTREDLHRLAERLTAAERRVLSEVRRGEPVEQILCAGGEHAVDLIVFPVRGHGVRPWGTDASVTAAVLRRAEVPVLMLPDLAHQETPASTAR